MNDQIPGYAVFLVYLMEAAVILMAVTLVGIVVVAFWLAVKNNRNQQGEQGDSGSGGGGSKGNSPGKPPKGPSGGPKTDMDEQFHELANAVGKTIQIEKKDEEKVLS